MSYFESIGFINHPYHEGYTAQKFKRGALFVLKSVSTMRDGSIWNHVSVSRSDRCPTWEEMTLVKNHLIGKEAEAIQVMVSSKEHVNLHSYCLHIWSRIDGDLGIPNLHDIVEEVAP